MGATEILAECARIGVSLEAQSDGLHIKRASAVSPELKARIRKAKPELLALLKSAQPAPEPAAKSDTGGLPAVLAVPVSGDGQNLSTGRVWDDLDSHGRPLYGCWNCGCREYARDLAGHGWVCVRDHPIEEYRAHVDRWTASLLSRRGGA